MEICEPATLARIPRPQIEKGRTFFSHVFSVHNGVKRRRQEICAAVDGDSINVYEIQNGRNLSSCPIPPDSLLSCPPCSLRSRSPKGRTSRFTYFSTQHRNEMEISVFQETSDDTGRRPLQRSIRLDSIAVPVVQLTVLPTIDSHRILALRQDGCYEIHNADFSERLIQGRLDTGADNGKILAALWMSVSQASKSVLKNRPDILAMAEPDHSFVIGVISKMEQHVSTANQEIELGVWHLYGPTFVPVPGSTSDMVLSHKVSISCPILPMEKDPVVFAAKDTRLLIKAQSKTYTFDLTSTTLKMVQEIAPIGTDQLSNIYISDALTLSSTSVSLQLHNSQFRTLQVKLDLIKPGLKRKRAHSQPGLIVFIAYFTSLRKALAIRRDQLVTIELRVSGNESFAATSKRSSLLINNIGKGIASQERLRAIDRVVQTAIGRTRSQGEEVDQWYKTIKHLDRCIQEGDTRDFESTCLRNLDPELKSGSGRSEAVLNHQIDYMLSKMFEYEETPEDFTQTESRKLKLVIYVPKLIVALATKGHLSTERLGKVLRVPARPNFEAIKFGKISQLLFDSDDSLVLLGEYLLKTPYIPYQELCQALVILLRRALAEVQQISTTEATRRVHTALRKESTMTDDASSIREDNDVVQLTTTCMSIAVTRLTGTSQFRLSEYMRAHFAQRDIIALVQFLRQQLFRSGYTRSFQTQIYPTPPPSEHGTNSDINELSKTSTELTLAAIVSVLSSCMDVIGPLGMVSFGNEQDFMQTLIPDLSSEVTKATEAVQDSVFLCGVLRETLRFVESKSGTKIDSEEVQNDAIQRPRNQGAIVTLYSEAPVEGDMMQDSGLLPLSLRAENHIDVTKVRKGDGKVSKRSVREMGMLQDRLRGPYALERLTV